MPKTLVWWMKNATHMKAKTYPVMRRSAQGSLGLVTTILEGFYGGCNEELMRIELVKNGPISVAFEVYSDFFNYKGGIYHHTGEILEQPCHL